MSGPLVNRLGQTESLLGTARGQQVNHLKWTEANAAGWLRERRKAEGTG